MTAPTGFSLPSRRLRRHVLDMAKAGNSVHIACAYSLIEIVSVLYTSFVRFDRKDPRAAKRDLVCLSKGHGVMALYACFVEIGWLGREHIDAYFSDGSLLKGLGDPHVPGIEVMGGSLGHGLSVAVGMALGAKMRGADQRTFCIVGDGEMNEGSMWESLLFAAHHGLSKLVVIIDANDFQAMGRSTEVLNCEPFRSKMEAFGFETQECDGHDTGALAAAFKHAVRSEADRPQAIIARTVKGYGISFMAGINDWHYTRLTPELYQRAYEELADA